MITVSIIIDSVWFLLMVFGVYRRSPNEIIFDGNNTIIHEHVNLPIDGNDYHIVFNMNLLQKEEHKRLRNRSFYSFKTTLPCVFIAAFLIIYLWRNHAIVAWLKYGDLEMKQQLYLEIWQRIMLTFLLFWGNFAPLVVRNPLRKKLIKQFIYRVMFMTTISQTALKRDELNNQLANINTNTENGLITGDVDGKTNLRYLEINSLLFGPFDQNNNLTVPLDSSSYNDVIQLENQNNESELNLNSAKFIIRKNTFNMIPNCKVNGKLVHLVVVKSKNHMVIAFTKNTERHIKLFKKICMEWYVEEKTKWFEDDMYRRLNIRDKLAVISYGWPCQRCNSHNSQYNTSTTVINCDGEEFGVVFNPDEKAKLHYYDIVSRPRAGWIS